MSTFYSLLDQYGLWALALGSFFQSYVFVVLAGFLAAGDVLNITDVIVVGAVSSWVGHWFFYFLGFVLSKQRSLISQSRIKTMLTTMERAITGHPWKSIFIMQYGYGIRLVSAIAFGFFKINWKWFAMAQLLNCSLWAVLLSFIGFFASMGIFALPSPARIPGIITFISLVLLVFLFHKSRRNIPSLPIPSDQLHQKELSDVE